MTSVDDRDSDATFENEQSTVTITLKEYDKLKERSKYITDRNLIGCIDKIEELVRALRVINPRDGAQSISIKS